MLRLDRPAVAIMPTAPITAKMAPTLPTIAGSMKVNVSMLVTSGVEKHINNQPADQQIPEYHIVNGVEPFLLFYELIELHAESVNR